MVGWDDRVKAQSSDGDEEAFSVGNVARTLNLFLTSTPSPHASCVQPCRSRDEPLAPLPATDFTSRPPEVLPPIKAPQEFSKLFNYEPSCIQNFRANFR